MYTATERLEIYGKMLPYFADSERLTKRMDIHVYGFCAAYRELTERGDLWRLHELWFFKSEDRSPYWFDPIKKGIDYERRNILFHCIKTITENEKITTEQFKNAIGKYASDYLTWYNGTTGHNEEKETTN